MLWIICYGATVLFSLYIFLDITWRLWIRKFSFLPNLPHIPWLGAVPYLMFKDSATLLKLRMSSTKEHNHLFVKWYLWTPFVIISRVEYIEALMKSKGPIIKPNLSYKVLIDLLGDGLVTSAGEKWKKRRHALTGAFHLSILYDVVKIFEKHGMQLVKKLKEFSCGGKAVEVQRWLQLVTLDIICEASMGVNIDSFNSSDCEYSQALEFVKLQFTKRVFNPLLAIEAIYKHTRDGKKYYIALKTLHNFAINVINENISARQKSSSGADAYKDDSGLYHGRRKVFMDILLDMYDKGEIDVEGIKEEIHTFIAAGHDTTSASLSWLLYEIGRHPEIQQKLHEEIDEVSSKDGSLIDKIHMLKYTECVIKENLRLNPAVPWFSRILGKDLPVGENIIPAGTIMVVDMFSLHQNRVYWDDPTVFNPERFHSDVKRNPYCFIPFSAGSRNCIGQKFALLEEKILIYMLLSYFNIESTQTRDELVVTSDVTTECRNGLYLKFSCRK